jgi:hypothetical protein
MARLVCRLDTDTLSDTPTLWLRKSGSHICKVTSPTKCLHAACVARTATTSYQLLAELDNTLSFTPPLAQLNGSE